MKLILELHDNSFDKVPIELHHILGGLHSLMVEVFEKTEFYTNKDGKIFRTAMRDMVLIHNL